LIGYGERTRAVYAIHQGDKRTITVVLDRRDYDVIDALARARKMPNGRYARYLLQHAMRDARLIHAIDRRGR